MLEAGGNFLLRSPSWVRLNLCESASRSVSVSDLNWKYGMGYVLLLLLVVVADHRDWIGSKDPLASGNFVSSFPVAFTVNSIPIVYDCTKTVWIVVFLVRRRGIWKRSAHKMTPINFGLHYFLNINQENM